VTCPFVDNSDYIFIIRCFGKQGVTTALVKKTLINSDILNGLLSTWFKNKKSGKIFIM